MWVYKKVQERQLQILDKGRTTTHNLVYKVSYMNSNLQGKQSKMWINIQV